MNSYTIGLVCALGDSAGVTNLGITGEACDNDDGKISVTVEDGRVIVTKVG
jgi:hypothetical protein